MGGFNGDLGNSLGDKGKREPNLRGLKSLDFANCLNLCPVNLMKMCPGPLEAFNSYCGRFCHSTLDYIFLPNCLLSSIKLAKTSDDDVDNTSDHLPIQQKLCYTVILVTVFRHVTKAPRIRDQNRKYIGQNFHLKQ